MARARLIKTELYDQFARIGKAAASPQRLELLDLLSQAERPVEELARETNLAFANASRHLQILRNAHLVETQKKGVQVYYRLADEEVHAFFRMMHRLAEKRLAEVYQIMEDYFGHRRNLESLNRNELLRCARKGRVTILDVRPRIEYESAHLPCAKSIPLCELKSRLDELPKDQEIVAYCRGPYCVLAQQAIKYLRTKGYKAIRFEDGISEWRDAGLPLVKGK